MSTDLPAPAPAEPPATPAHRKWQAGWFLAITLGLAGAAIFRPPTFGGMATCQSKMFFNLSCPG
jgi:hypothetical protein